MIYNPSFPTPTLCRCAIDRCDDSYAASIILIWLDDDSYFNGTSEISDKDYLSMKNDITFINVLNLAMNENEMVKNRAQRTAGNVQNLINFIDEELREQ